MDDLQNKQYIKMTQTPVWKLIITLGIPTTISMLITNIYNMADTYFVSQISVAASGATGIVFSIMAIIQAFGFMYGHGAGSNISRQLGAKKVDEAKSYASTSFFLAIFTGFLIAVLGVVFITPFMKLLGSTDTILNDAKTYGFFILIAAPAMCSSCVLNNILRYEGKATFAMIGLTSGGILNMCVDPILIFGLNMGTAGAGLSTTISQYISVVILLWPFLTGKTVTKINIRYFTKKAAVVFNIITTGLPSFVRQGMNSLSTTILNTSAAAYGDVAIASMSVVNRCNNLLFSSALGIAQGFQPVSAFNYGSKKYDRVKKGCMFTMAFGVCLLGALCVICYGFAPEIIGLFRKEPEIIEIGSTTLRYFCFTLFTLPITSVGSMLFQSTGYKKQALFISMIQSGLIYIPMLLILPHFFNLTGIEIAQPVSYVLSAIITIPIVLNYFHHLDLGEVL